MNESLYRRPLPGAAIAFASPEGRRVFTEALALGGLEGYFGLAEQFHTQSDPAFCGLGSLVVALNGLGIDPGRLWKGPWRWFAEDLLDCCVPLERVRARGLTLDELACLAQCNGADVDLQRAGETDFDRFRAALERAARSEDVMIASYDRATLGQTGSGHFSPIGGFHATRELVLILDVARFKYPPHWVLATNLWSAMQPVDPETGHSRGWVALRRRVHQSTLGFTMRCDDSLEGLAQRLAAATATLEPSTDLASIARSLAPLAPYLEVRSAGEARHREALAAARASLRSRDGFSEIAQAVGSERAEAVTILMLAISAHLTPSQRALLGNGGDSHDDALLLEELANLRAQLTALWSHAHRN